MIMPTTNKNTYVFYSQYGLPVSGLSPLMPHCFFL